MKPIGIFQHTEVGAPGSIVRIIESLGRDVKMVRIVDGDPVPSDASEFSGLVFLGGHMGAHDNFPWIPQELALIRDADARGLPVVGHCLGSQLVAFALGGHVQRHTQPEIGWSVITPIQSEISHEWWGPYAGGAIQTFQWHSDTFIPPKDAVQIASGMHCENQVFLLRNRHLMVQSHLEMTPELVELSLQRNGAQLVREYAAGNTSVTSIAETRRDLPERTAAMEAILRQLYTRWMKGSQ